MIGVLKKKSNVIKNHGILVTADFAALEIRVVASLACELNLLDAIKKGKDPHTYVASIMFQMPYEEVTKHVRSIAKCVTGNTLIHTNKGQLPIKDIVPEVSDGKLIPYDGDIQILTLDGYRRIHETLYRSSSEVVEVCLADDTKLKCTPDHRFVVGFDNKDVPIFKEAQYLNKKDKVFILLKSLVLTKPQFEKVFVKSIKTLDKKEPVYDLVEPKYKLFITNNILTEDCLNFGVLFQKGPTSLAEEIPGEDGKIPCSLAYAESMIEKYFIPNTSLKSWIDAVQKYSENTGFIRTCTGRVICHEGRTDETMRVAVNYPIQGPASDFSGIGSLGLHYYIEYLITHFKKEDIDFKACVFNIVHDEIAVDCTRESSMYIAEGYTYFMKEFPREFGYMFTDAEPDLKLNLQDKIEGCAFNYNNDLVTVTGEGYKKDIESISERLDGSFVTEAEKSSTQDVFDSLKFKVNYNLSLGKEKIHCKTKLTYNSDLVFNQDLVNNAIDYALDKIGRDNLDLLRQGVVDYVFEFTGRDENYLKTVIVNPLPSSEVLTN